MSLNLKWTGVGSAISGSTPFGIYDNDTDFKNDGPKTAVWCAKRLGYPIVDVEMVDEQFYACFEESVSEYSAQINQFNLRNNLDVLRGQPKGKVANYSQTLVDGSFLPTTVRMSQQYGTLAGVGGNTAIQKAYIDLIPGQQKYNLMSASVDIETSGSFQTMFSGKFRIVDNTKNGNNITQNVQKAVDGFIREPLRNPIGKNWIIQARILKQANLIKR